MHLIYFNSFVFVCVCPSVCLLVASCFCVLCLYLFCLYLLLFYACWLAFALLAARCCIVCMESVLLSFRCWYVQSFAYVSLTFAEMIRIQHVIGQFQGNRFESSDSVIDTQHDDWVVTIHVVASSIFCECSKQPSIFIADQGFFHASVMLFIVSIMWHCQMACRVSRLAEVTTSIREFRRREFVTWFAAAHKLDLSSSQRVAQREFVTRLAAAHIWS